MTKVEVIQRLGKKVKNHCHKTGRRGRKPVLTVKCGEKGGDGE